MHFRSYSKELSAVTGDLCGTLIVKVCTTLSVDDSRLSIGQFMNLRPEVFIPCHGVISAVVLVIHNAAVNIPRFPIRRQGNDIGTFSSFNLTVPMHPSPLRA